MLTFGCWLSVHKMVIFFKLGQHMTGRKLVLTVGYLGEAKQDESTERFDCAQSDDADQSSGSQRFLHVLQNLVPRYRDQTVNT